jgi:hypothetical protein
MVDIREYTAWSTGTLVARNFIGQDAAQESSQRKEGIG